MSLHVIDARVKHTNCLRSCYGQLYVCVFVACALSTILGQRTQLPHSGMATQLNTKKPS